MCLLPFTQKLYAKTFQGLRYVYRFKTTSSSTKEGAASQACPMGWQPSADHLLHASFIAAEIADDLQKRWRKKHKRRQNRRQRELQRALKSAAFLYMGDTNWRRIGIACLERQPWILQGERIYWCLICPLIKNSRKSQAGAWNAPGGWNWDGKSVFVRRTTILNSSQKENQKASSPTVEKIGSDAIE